MRQSSSAHRIGYSTPFFSVSESLPEANPRSDGPQKPAAHPEPKTLHGGPGLSDGRGGTSGRRGSVRFTEPVILTQAVILLYRQPVLPQNTD